MIFNLFRRKWGTMADKLKTGDKVRDTVTGLEGTVVAITEWLNGCIRVTVQPPVVKDGKPVDATTFDIQQLELTADSAPRVLQRTGGPYPEPTRNTI